MISAAHRPSGAAPLRRWGGRALVAAAVLAWVLFLRPQPFGGPASYVLVSGHSMRPQLETGDLVITQRKDAYARGDVIAYRIPRGEPGAGAYVIHRITGGSPHDGYRTQGDNREEPDLWRPRPRDIEGRLWVRVPKAGSLIALLSAPIPLATAAGLLTFLTVGGGGGRLRAIRRVGH
jgi:signal peptidase I